MTWAHREYVINIHISQLFVFKLEYPNIIAISIGHYTTIIVSPRYWIYTSYITVTMIRAIATSWQLVRPGLTLCTMLLNVWVDNIFNTLVLHKTFCVCRWPIVTTVVHNRDRHIFILLLFILLLAPVTYVQPSTAIWINHIAS